MNQPSTAQATAITLERAPDTFWGDVFDSFFRPSERFARLRLRPQWVAPVLILAFLSVFITFLHQNVVPYSSQVQAKIDQTEKVAGPLSHEEKERMAQQPGIASQATWLGFIAVFTCVTVLACALAFWLSVIVSGGDLCFPTMFAITAHAMLVSSMAWTFCATAVLLIKDPGTIDPVRLDNVVLSNLGAVFNLEVAHPFLQSVLGSIDLFSIWTVVLISIGISSCTKKSVSKSVIPVAAVWGIYIVAKGLLAMWLPVIA